MAEGAYLAEQMLKHVFSPGRGLFSILGYMIRREICFPAIKKEKNQFFSSFFEKGGRPHASNRRSCRCNRRSDIRS